jgi:DNA-binding response OmpR family regulator
VRLLRPHLVRLRNKLEKYPDLAHRIINVRGNGYMMI